MRVLNSGDFPLITYCNDCGAKIEIENEKDVEYGHIGMYKFICPCCGAESYIDTLDGLTLTQENLKFPDHFYEYSSGKLTNDKIKESVANCIDFLRKHPDECYCEHIGNTFMCVFTNDEDELYQIVATDRYYETEISYGPEDQKTRGFQRPDKIKND